MRNIIVSSALVILATFSQLFEGECVPVPNILPSKELLDYMIWYGYIKSRDKQAGYSGYSASDVQSAIQQMQAFGGLPQTGELDPATLNLMRAPRCGVPDILPNDEDAKTRKKRYKIQSKRWKKKVLTYFLANWPPAMDADVVRENLRKAFAVWSSVSPLRFEPREGSDADLIVMFGRGPHGDPYPFDGRGNVLAHAFFPGEGIGGDAHFDADELWVDAATHGTKDGGVDFYTMAVHELGHSLGLAHSTVNGSIMVPYYKRHPNMRLDYDDILAMHKLYNIRDNNFEDDSHSSETGRSTKPSRLRANHRYTLSTKSGDICEGSIDAAGLIRGELFVFKGTLMWKFKDRNEMFPGYPVDFHRFFTEIPKTIQSIDAVYQRPNDSHIILFTGNMVWEFDGNRFTADSPRGLSSLGLPRDLDHLDAAMVWAKDGRTYFFRGDRYWGFNESLGTIEAGYPQGIVRWRGLLPSLDAALTWKDGITYFFKDQKFWSFNNQNVAIDGNFPLQTAEHWFGCQQ